MLSCVAVPHHLHCIRDATGVVEFAARRAGSDVRGAAAAAAAAGGVEEEEEKDKEEEEE